MIIVLGLVLSRVAAGRGIREKARISVSAAFTGFQGIVKAAKNSRGPVMFRDQDDTAGTHDGQPLSYSCSKVAPEPSMLVSQARGVKGDNYPLRRPNKGRRRTGGRARPERSVDYWYSTSHYY